MQAAQTRFVDLLAGIIETESRHSASHGTRHDSSRSGLSRFSASQTQIRKSARAHLKDWCVPANPFGIQCYSFSHPRMHDTRGRFGFIHPLSAKREMWCVRIVQHRLSPFVEISLGFGCPVATVICATDTSRSLLTCLPGNKSPAGGAHTWDLVPCGHSGIIPSLRLWAWRTLWPLCPLFPPHCFYLVTIYLPITPAPPAQQNCRKVIKNKTWSGQMHKKNKTSLRCIIPWVRIQHKHLRLKFQTELTWTAGPFARCKGNRTKKKNWTRPAPWSRSVLLQSEATIRQKSRKSRFQPVFWSRETLSPFRQERRVRLDFELVGQCQKFWLLAFSHLILRIGHWVLRTHNTHNLLGATPK